ncbi:Iron transport multicopper oxidase FET3 [Fusarium oxysporum]|uniref:Iron transport multicopper oxidase FET3 n=1 Tax=Fusarium oxysporum TaxID=5507 RepID=A0A420RHN2_FUSOX|nr:Iron transport multicopper oxidase FET3 [Fusarium oxysporum]
MLTSKITQPGTYWYHSHTESQYPDGLRGPLIIHDSKSPFKGKYDEELIMTISDWYHDQMQTLIPEFMRKGNPTGAEPVPQAALMNETQDLRVPVQTGKTYFLRLANIGAFAGQYFWIEGHNMTIVEVDGAYTKPAQANMVYLSAGQRCSVLIATKDDASANFPIVASMDTVSWLVYDEEKPLPKQSVVYDFDPYDDMDLVPYDEMVRLPEPSRSIELDVIMDNLRDGANYAFFNNITYRAPKVPTLYTALTSGKQATNPQIYGTYTHSFVLQKDEIVQLVINNRDDGRHPFHLHGHHFQVLHRSDDDAGDFDGSVEFAETPMRRDTVVVNGNGNVVLRFMADNPDPLALQASLKLPQNHLDACKAGNIPTVGNAAGNTDLLDLSGENVPPPRLPEGTFMGIFGIYTVASYGMKKDKKTPETAPLLAEEEPQH